GVEVLRERVHERVEGEELQLAMVARPGVRYEPPKRRFGKEDREGVAPRAGGLRLAEDDCVVLLDEVVRCRVSREVGAHQRSELLGAKRVEEGEADQVGQVLGPLAQRRYPQPGRRIEARVEGLP